MSRMCGGVSRMHIDQGWTRADEHVRTCSPSARRRAATNKFVEDPTLYAGPRDLERAAIVNRLSFKAPKSTDAHDCVGTEAPMLVTTDAVPETSSSCSVAHEVEPSADLDAELYAKAEAVFLQLKAEAAAEAAAECRREEAEAAAMLWRVQSRRRSEAEVELQTTGHDADVVMLRDSEDINGLVRALGGRTRSIAADALASLAGESDANKAAIIQAGGIFPLVGLIRTGSEKGSMAALKTLYNLMPECRLFQADEPRGGLGASYQEAAARMPALESLAAMVQSRNAADREKAADCLLSCLTKFDMVELSCTMMTDPPCGGPNESGSVLVAPARG